MLDSSNIQSVVITGASSGIGRATALLLAQAQYRVFAGVRTTQAAEALLSVCPSTTLIPVNLDVTREDQIRAAVALISETLGPAGGLAALINNAGIVLCSPLETCPIALIRDQFEVNLIGQLAVTQAFLPLIRKCQGRIINIGSISGRFSPPYLGAYAATKHAIEAMTDALRRELLPEGIRVCLIEPGAIETAVWNKSEDTYRSGLGAELFGGPGSHYTAALRAIQHLSARLRAKATRPEVVAKLITRIIQTPSPKSRYLLGLDAKAQAWMEQWVPVRWADRLIESVLVRAGGGGS
ncbi:MAG: hypothetical protein AUK55_04645 [Syntrophobacteraceae bacterium CG2_30_61_12]|nr:MAG: hypothetical protein AUK55_04645 [Syntrophobacteraceae bacterium CG2_30_61_12]